MSDGEEGGSFFTMILGLPSVLDAKGDFFPPGGVLSLEDIVINSDPPFWFPYLSAEVIAGASGAYDRGLGCRSCIPIGAGLGAATAVDISTNAVVNNPHPEVSTIQIRPISLAVAAELSEKGADFDPELISCTVVPMV